MIVDINKLMCAISIIGLCEPLGLYSNPYIHPIFSFFKILALCYAIIIIINEKYWNDPFVLIVIVWGLFMLWPTVVSNGDIRVWFREFYMYSSIIIISQYWMRRDYEFLIKISAVFMTCVLVTNCLSYFYLGADIMADGSYGGNGINYIIGGRIRIGDWALVALAITAIHGVKSKYYGKLFTISLISASVFIVGNWVSTSVLCIIILIILIVIIKPEYDLNKIIKFGFMISGVLCLLIIGLNVQERFSWIIVRLLGEDTTLNGRTAIWKSVLLQVLDKPIIGHGYGTTKNFIISVSQYSTKATSGTHNQYLAWLYDGGIISLILCVIIVILAINGLKYCRNLRARKILGVVLITYFILMIPEVACSNTCFFLLLAIIRNSEMIEDEYTVMPEGNYS